MGTVDRATSTEVLPVSPARSPAMEDADLYPVHCLELSPASSFQSISATNCITESGGSYLQSPQNIPGDPQKEQTTPSVSSSVLSNFILEQELAAVSVSSSSLEDVFGSPKVDGTDLTESQEVAGTASPKGQVVIGRAVSCTESSTKLATRLKRRSNGTAALSLDVDNEMLVILEEREQEIEQLNSNNARMVDILNQANAEIVRYKEVSYCCDE